MSYLNTRWNVAGLPQSIKEAWQQHMFELDNGVMFEGFYDFEERLVSLLFASHGDPFNKTVGGI